MKFIQHVKRALEKARTELARISRISRVNLEYATRKLLISKAVIPIIAYGSEIWGEKARSIVQ